MVEATNSTNVPATMIRAEGQRRGNNTLPKFDTLFFLGQAYLLLLEPRGYKGFGKDIICIRTTLTYAGFSRFSISGNKGTSSVWLSVQVLCTCYKVENEYTAEICYHSVTENIRNPMEIIELKTYYSELETLVAQISVNHSRDPVA